MNVTLLIPAAWLATFGIQDHLQSDPKEVTDGVKSVLDAALSNPLSDDVLRLLEQEQPPLAGKNVRVMFSLKSAQSSVLASLAEQHGLSAGPMAKRLLGLAAQGDMDVQALQRVQRTVDPQHPLAILNAAIKKTPRLAQAQLFDNLWESMTSNRVGLVEGGTGIGKTRAMMAAAVRWVDQKHAHIGICAPTIALLRQLVDEHQTHHNAIGAPPLRLMIGRSEFVSEDGLREFLQGNGAQWDTPEVREWLKTGGVESYNGVLDVSWQTYSLRQVSPSLPMDEVILGDVSTTSDRGYMAYRAQFNQRSHNPAYNEIPSILVFTHAMLAQDMRRKSMAAGQDETYAAMQNFYIGALRNVKGKKRIDNQEDFLAIDVLEAEMGVAFNTASDGRSILPSFTCLLVDEGHLLDESMSSALSDYVSLRAIRSDLVAFKKLGGKVTPQGIEIVDNSIKTLITRAPKVDKRDFVSLAADGDSNLIPHLVAIADVCNSISTVRDASTDKYRLSLKIRRAGIVINSAINRNRKTSFLRHSPVKSLPQLFVSNSNVQTILSRLWSSLESAALVSATLYMPTSDGQTANFMASLLQVPLSRMLTFAPVHEDWSTHCVEGVWLAQSNGDWLYPPVSIMPGASKPRTVLEREEAELKWHSEVATEVERIWLDSAGGVLVLCTSYATVYAIQSILKDRAGLDGSIVAASPTLGLGSQSDAFMKLSQASIKPLWLAVGGAWTGVDIGGHSPWKRLFGDEISPASDNVLTDLVIPRIPFGANQSVSHLWRIRNSPNVPWELFDAALRFKQALGRLVRRDQLPSNRRIFVLDARMSDERQGQRMTAFTRSLGRYKKRIYMRATSQ